MADILQLHEPRVRQRFDHDVLSLPWAERIVLSPDDQGRAKDVRKERREGPVVHACHRLAGVAVTIAVPERGEIAFDERIDIERVHAMQARERVLSEIPANRVAVARAYEFDRLSVSLRRARTYDRGRSDRDHAAHEIGPGRCYPQHDRAAQRVADQRAGFGAEHLKELDQVAAELLQRAVRVAEGRVAVTADVVGVGAELGGERALLYQPALETLSEAVREDGLGASPHRRKAVGSTSGFIETPFHLRARLGRIARSEGADPPRRVCRPPGARRGCPAAGS